jgi:hypothetical protein
MSSKPTHAWMREIHVAYVPGPRDGFLDELAPQLLFAFTRLGHDVKETPDDETDVVLTTARFGEPLDWREALIFNVRRRYGLRHRPTIYTLIHASRAKFNRALARFDAVSMNELVDSAAIDLPGLSPTAYHVLAEQGRRGGPILALQRVLQAQAKSVRVLLVVGDQQAEDFFHFDLVGAYPRSEGDTLAEIYDDTVRRIATTVSTKEVTAHEVVGPTIPRSLWVDLATPLAMTIAGRELGRRGFFTEMVKIVDLVQVPAVTAGVASQYSEGCFATWDQTLNALITTVTGSARPVDKGDITNDDLAVIVGVRHDGTGAQVRQVEGNRNDPPSSEAVEMIDMDGLLPSVEFEGTRVPVVRSKLHGHRSIAGYDPRHVEFVPLDDPYYHYLVSCATEAQAEGIKSAFARSQTMQDPSDARSLAFTVLPGHGCFIAEKWAKGKAPFETIWQFMDVGYLEVESRISQGPMSYSKKSDGKMRRDPSPLSNTALALS